ncbi:NPCBM/NEW2 domain-containing protein [Glycomyces dulcitolivorans]|uniref:NPCBM/NEW2 domain-containing protein n=1 Tax=Glycomyces dulcitolivorans TaxID=2200759 RepID=UPI000DD40C9E|nr:NPCBM/NEW2 domain-containing protein [Glycomyces dulcitolivorans]
MRTPNPSRPQRSPHRRLAAAVALALAAAALAAGPAAAKPEPGGGQPDTAADTPPMGFNNWNATQCGEDFNEDMIMGIADLFVEKGLKDAGYEYINLDDCWAEYDRDENGKLVVNAERFPSGFEALADYIHSKGLKFGVYTSAGTRTCSGDMPGSLGHEASDAQQFADWGVDYLKYDNCNNQGVPAEERYAAMGDALEATGRDIVYSICEWGDNEPWSGWAEEVGGDLWRTTFDISDSYGSMLSIFKDNVELAEYAGPGGWNDPDMLQVGNGGMTDTEYRSHFSLWAMMAAPLLIGTDLRDATDATYEILGNEEVIAVDQDRLGEQAAVVSPEDGLWVLKKRLADGSYAVALFNETGAAQTIATDADAIGLRRSGSYQIRDLWEHETYETAGTIAATVPAHGTVVYKVAASHAGSSPADVQVGGSDLGQVEAGDAAALTATAVNNGRTTVESVSVDVDAPRGWDVDATTDTRARTLKSGRTFTTEWEVTAPDGAAPGAYEITVTLEYKSKGKRVERDLVLTAVVVEPPPGGTSYLSDVDWVSAVNESGEVQRDAAALGFNGTSGPITIGGTVYEKGLGTVATSEVVYYLGGRCGAFAADVGLDDSAFGTGAVTFEVWADGEKVAASAALTGDDAAAALAADLTGASSVRLTATSDGSGGIGRLAADWADATITCAA